MSGSLTGRQVIQVVAIVLLAGLVVWVLALWLPLAYDMHTFFYPAIHDWLDGGLSDADWPDLNYTPWELMVFVPFALAPEPVGRALFLVFAIGVIVWATRSFARRRLALAMVFVSFPVLAMFWMGNMEPFPLLGAALSAWAIRERRPWVLGLGLVLLATKPQEAFLVAPVLLWAVRRWRRSEWVQVALAPIVVAFLTVALFDWSWLRKLLNAPGGYQSRWMWINISMWWRFAPYGVAWLCSIGVAVAGLVLIIRRRFDEYALALAVTFGAVASPYLATHHLVLPMTLAWPWLLDRKPWLAVLVYLTSLTPLARLGGDQSVNWLDFLFPLTLAVTLLFFYRQSARSEGHRSVSTEVAA